MSLSQEEIRAKIMEHASTLKGQADAAKCECLREEQQKYIEDRAKLIYQSYIQQPAVVKQADLEVLKNYKANISTHYHDLATEVANLESTLVTLSSVSLSSFSTLFHAPNFF